MLKFATCQYILLATDGTVCKLKIKIKMCSSLRFVPCIISIYINNIIFDGCLLVFNICLNFELSIQSKALSKSVKAICIPSFFSPYLFNSFPQPLPIYIWLLPVLSLFSSFSLPDELCDPTDSIWKKGTSFEAITGRTAPSSDCFLAEVFLGFPQVR